MSSTSPLAGLKLFCWCASGNVLLCFVVEQSCSLLYLKCFQKVFGVSKHNETVSTGMSIGTACDPFLSYLMISIFVCSEASYKSTEQPVPTACDLGRFLFDPSTTTMHIVYDVFGVLWFRPSCVADLWKDCLTLGLLRFFPRLVLVSAGISNAGYEFEAYYSRLAAILEREASPAEIAVDAIRRWLHQTS